MTVFCELLWRRMWSPWGLAGLMVLFGVASGPAQSPVIELRIVGPEGKPVPGANVEVRKRGNRNYGPDHVVVGEFVRDANYGVFYKANENGELHLKPVEETNGFTFSVITPGYGPYWADWEGILPDKFTAELDAAWTVGGILVDEQGNPIPNASVHPSLEYKKRPGNDFQLGMGNRVKTDAEGRFRFESVPENLTEVNVTIAAEGFRPLNTQLTRGEYGVDADLLPVAKIVLDKGISVVGKVTFQGQPVAEALVRTKILNEERDAKTDAEGHFILPGCTEGLVRVVVSAPGKALAFQDVRVERVTDPVNFELQPGNTVRIKVIDHADKPVEKARIFFQYWGTNKNNAGHVDYFEFDHVQQYTSADGVWEWNEAPVEGFMADISPGAAQGMSLDEEPFLPREEEYVVKLLPPLVITATVTDAETKEPIPAFRYMPILHWEENSLHLDREDALDGKAGKFVLKPNRVLFGHGVRVEAAGYRGMTSRLIKSDEGNVSLEFQMQKAIDVFGKVLTPDGEPAAGTKLALGVQDTHVRVVNGSIDNRNTSCAMTSADKDGRFRLPAPGSEFILYLTHPTGYAQVESKDEAADKVIVLQRWASVKGILMTAGKPAPNVPISLDTFGWRAQSEPNGPSAHSDFDTVADAEGRFVFPHVFPGLATLGRDIIFTTNEGVPEPISAKRIQVVLEAGVEAAVVIGGSGRTATFQVVPPAGFEGEFPWQFVSVGVGGKGDNDRTSFWARVGKEGLLRITDIDPGTYELNIFTVQQVSGQISGHEFVVPEGPIEEVVDLGKVQLQ